MLKTYFKLAFRNLLKSKAFSLINISGLAIGLTCCLLISMYIYQEFSYDTQQQLGDRLYQIGTLSTIDGKAERTGHTPAPMAPAMQQEFPEVESFTRLIDAFQDDKTLLQYKEGKDVRAFYETKAYFADSTFFRLFTYDFREGNPYTALNEPNSVVISQDIAEKIFGKEPALNRIIHINSTTNGAYDYKITGVFAPSRVPSHIDARLMLSLKGGDMGDWVRSMGNDMLNNNMFYSYLLLKPGTDPKKLEAKFDNFIERYAGQELKATGRNKKQYLTRVGDIHLYANDSGNVTAGGSLTYIYTLMSIALVTLLIACVNFMNLSTARSSKRALEIGVRKVLGAEKQSLVWQFLMEAILMALIAYMIAIGASYLLRPLFEQVSGKELVFSGKQYVIIATGFFFVAIISGMVAGLYPAFYLSAFKPIKVLKGKFSNSLAAISFRRVLVVFQFFISVALIVASIIISRQMNFLRSKDLGFQREQQVVIPLRTSTAKTIYPALKDELETDPSITSTGASVYYPGIRNSQDWLLYKEGTSAAQNKDIYMNHIDNSFLQTLGIKPVAGRLFSREFPADTNNRIILNEQAVKTFGFASPEDAIGKNIVGEFGSQRNFFSIVGVVKDFHFKDLHSDIESYGFLLSRDPSYNYMIAHVKPGNIQSTINSIAANWVKLNPNEPFEYSFLDQDFQKNYLAEERLSSIIRYFTIVAIFISCLGLFGLTTFSVEQRIKEIGIRKVLGASTSGIVTLVSKDFIKLVIIAFVIASPIAWWAMNKWLQAFAYRITIQWWVFALAGSLALLIAFATMSLQAIKAALANPVKSLRTE